MLGAKAWRGAMATGRWLYYGRQAMQGEGLDLLIILRDGLASSLVGGVWLALEAVGTGRRAAVLLTQEALAAAVVGSFRWPRELSGQHVRLLLAQRGGEEGLPVLGRGEGRQLDVRGLLERVHREGVPVLACPYWASLLGLEGRLPPFISPLTREELWGLISSARRVLGTL